MLCFSPWSPVPSPSSIKKTILITAGPTEEPLDPVRYFSNRSSGKMGYALANAALKKNFRVILISGPVQLKPPGKAEFISVRTAREMYSAVMKNYKKADIVIKVAAVSDYRPAKISINKIKKSKNHLNLKLIKNPDILKTLGKKKKQNQILIGFAAETNNIIKNAMLKLKDKNCDWLILNKVSKNEMGFQSNDNEVILFSRIGKRQHLAKQSKLRIAHKILKLVEASPPQA